MSAFEKSVKCEDIAPLLVFYACNEVCDRERKQIDAHVASCPACAAQLAEESQLQEAMVAAPPPADEPDSCGILLPPRPCETRIPPKASASAAGVAAHHGSLEALFSVRSGAGVW